MNHQLPILALRDVVVFPHIALPLYVGRPKSLEALELATRVYGNQIIVLTQRSAQSTEPKATDLYTVGTLAVIRQQTKMPDGNVKVLIEGKQRVRVTQITQSEPTFLGEYEPLASMEIDSEQTKVLMRNTINQFAAYLKVSGKNQNDQILPSLETIESADQLVDVIVNQLPLKIRDRQEILEIQNIGKRLDRLTKAILAEMEILKLDRRIKGRVRDQIEKMQRDHYLHEQMAAIQKELGNDDDPKSEAEELEKRLAKKKMPEAARERAKKEIKKLRTSAGHPAEAAVGRNYIDLILDLPWDEFSQDQNDLSRAEAILESDHHGLKEIKDRILDFLAVRMKVPEHKSPIVCFVGPPGVGKTSLARSIASCLNRKFERVSLGGLRDEAELKGHRRTYVGALPGKILGALKKAGTSNPVILLDEIDKVGMDFRGDPSSALLEILDPEQNKHFTDHYLDLEYDLSKVLFVVTANSLDPMSAPLRDRMEVIQLSGYTEMEKVAIAQKYLIPREKKNHGLDEDPISISDEGTNYIIRNYTRESGVRNLQREISKVFRRYVRDIAAGGENIELNSERIRKYLGTPKFKEQSRKCENEIGVVTGLAWTPVGGEVLEVEANLLPGTGKFQITGQLGNVMKESVKAALSYVRSLAPKFSLPEDFFQKRDIHVHVPEGAVPKDGPSAGITMATAILSAALRQAVRSDLGMTGEITLRGRVLPIGGLKEKLLAAQRAKLSTVLIPEANEKDLLEMDPQVTSGLEIIPVSTTEEVIAIALHKNLSSRDLRGQAAFEVPESIPPARRDLPTRGPSEISPAH